MKIQNRIMRKIIIITIMVLLCILTLGGCRLSKDLREHVSENNLTDEVLEEILLILNDGIWEDDVCQCVSDFSFEMQGNIIKYSSECGTFNDVTNRKHMNLTKQEKLKVNQLLGVESASPTPTKCPDSALPTLWMNGKLYKVETIEEGEAEFDEEDFIGTVESEVGYNKTPVKEMESNILPIGASVYKHRELEDIYVGIYRKSGLVYYYRIFEHKKSSEMTIEEAAEKKIEEKPIDQTTLTRIEVNSLLYGEYFDLKDTYWYEPKYNAAQWMNEEGELLFPYEQDLNNNTTMEGALALLYMPDEVLFKASTEDLLKVVMDGWLETNATSISVYSTPSHYIRSCTIKNQAANELMRRRDMVTVLYEDYCNRNYLKGEESREGRWAADKLQFDEIILASNHAFAMMDDEMKENVLNAALEKHGQVRSGYFYTVGHTSGFFAYIVEEELNGGSDWYQYIHDNNIEAAKNAISFNDTCWLEQFY